MKVVLIAILLVAGTLAIAEPAAASCPEPDQPCDPPPHPIDPLGECGPGWKDIVFCFI